MSLFFGFLLLLIFCYMFYIRHRKRHTIALHRHPHNIRRKRNEPGEVITTAEILGITEDARTEVIYLNELGR